MNPLKKQSTLAFLLSAACQELFPHRRLFIEHSLSDGYYCHFEKADRVVAADVDLIYGIMKDYLKSDSQLELCEVPKKKLAATFSKRNRKDKLGILNQWNIDPVPCIRFKSFIDYCFEPMNVDKASLYPFELHPYDVGFILRFPGMEESGCMKPFVDTPKLYQVIREHEECGDILGVSNIGELNRKVETGVVKEMIWVAEGLQEKKIAAIADDLCTGFPERRVVFVAGPSSSGKTTFSRRLGIQLKVNGYSTRPISMDDYYLDRERIPVDESGRRDYERITALDTDLLCRHVHQLLEGQAIQERKFDFTTGKGSRTGQIIEMSGNTFVIFEGIHGLNPIFAEGISEDRMQRIYVSALTQLNVDNEHRVSTSDNRLLRRLVRDRNFRGYAAEETLSRWSEVREGEERNIFPFQEDAAFMFNSSLVYEIPALATQAIPLLEEVKSESSNWEEVRRLLTFLSFFVQIPCTHIPETSILREFIGGSAFVE